MQRGALRVIVVVPCVCVCMCACVCFSDLLPHNGTMKERYQWIQCNTGVIFNFGNLAKNALFKSCRHLLVSTATNYS